MIKDRVNINVAPIPVLICDPCWEDNHSACERKGCLCRWTHEIKEEELLQ